MPKNSAKTILHCSHNTAGIVFILIGTLFILTGCTALYKALGLSDQQAQDQTAKDQTDRQKIIDQVRFTSTEIIITAVAGAGAILSGLLARWLGTERKITTALITGIEAAKDPNVKKSVAAKATAAGIEPSLHRRVTALT